MNHGLIHQLIQTARKYEDNARATDPWAEPERRAELWHRAIATRKAIHALMPPAVDPL
jgi:hypothetical protein